ncbi:hypothetical protein BRC72_11650 [Halobacteriales archaeon QH_7_66_36]|nr:MAG: hypothetical protein BRC72_11650 [Halobacteriales archaeon QH_7_66_36]
MSGFKFKTAENPCYFAFVLVNYVIDVVAVVRVGIELTVLLEKCGCRLDEYVVSLYLLSVKRFEPEHDSEGIIVNQSSQAI